MRIKEIEIYGYGKWVDKKFAVNEGLQVFLGQNEAGKSTLMSFIHSILFGFPTRTSKDLRYEPRASSKYGGKLIVEDKRFGLVQIERVHGKVTGDVTVTLEDGATGSEDLLATVLHDLDHVTFKNIYSFSLSDIENVHQLDKNKLSRYLFTIGALGTEHYLELVDDLQAEANELYRPSGRVRPLNIELEAIEQQEQELLELEKYNAQYLELLEKKQAQQEALQVLEWKQKDAQKKLADLIEIKKEWHVVEEVQELEKELAEIDLLPLKEDGFYLLEEYKKEREQLAHELKQLAIQIEEQKKKLSNPEMIQAYHENKELLHELEDDLPEMIEQLNVLHSLEEAEERLALDQKMRRAQLQIQEDSKTPQTFTSAEIEIVEGWQEAFEKEQEELTAFDQKIQELENKLASQHQKLDQLEAVMWSDSELDKVEEQLQKPVTPDVEKSSSQISPTFLFSLLLSGGLFLSTFFFQTPIKTVLLFSGFLALVLSLVFFFKGKKENKQIEEAPTDSSIELLRTQFEKQLELKEEWREALEKVDELQFAFEQEQAGFDRSLQMQKSLESNWHNLLFNHQLPDVFSLVEAEEKMEKTNEYIENQAEEEKIKNRMVEETKTLEKQTQGIDTLLPEEFPDVSEKVFAFRSHLRLLKNELAHENEKLEKLTALENQEKQLTQNQRSLGQKISYLVEMAGVESEEEFVELYELKKTYDTKSSRLKFLKENLPDLEASEFSNQEEIQQVEEKTSQELEKLTAEHKEALRQQASTQMTIEKIEKDGTYTEKLQAFENKKAVVQNYVDEWLSSKLAAGLIQKTLDQVTEEKFEKIIQAAEEYFALLTDENYKKIRFKDNELFVQKADGNLVDVRGLSRGTAEPLYVAIRLAYILQTAVKMDFPLIMDDPFVNFDQGRKEKMYTLLQKLAKDLQIIYFSFDPDVVSYFNEEEIIELNELK